MVSDAGEMLGPTRRNRTSWTEEDEVGQRVVSPNPTWQTWAEWLGEDPKPGTIYKDVLDMRCGRGSRRSSASRRRRRASTAPSTRG